MKVYWSYPSNLTKTKSLRLNRRKTSAISCAKAVTPDQYHYKDNREKVRTEAVATKKSTWPWRKPVRRLNTLTTGWIHEIWESNEKEADGNRKTVPLPQPKRVQNLKVYHPTIRWYIFIPCSWSLLPVPHDPSLGALQGSSHAYRIHSPVKSNP